MSVFPCAVQGDTLNIAGAVLLAPPQSHVRFNGVLVAVVGTGVADHGSGVHDAAIMAGGSACFAINGLAVVRTGSPADCGHLAIGTSHVTVSA